MSVYVNVGRYDMYAQTLSRGVNTREMYSFFWS